jgi:hypothetical protein
VERQFSTTKKSICAVMFNSPQMSTIAYLAGMSTLAVSFFIFAAGVEDIECKRPHRIEGYRVRISC